ncbi:MAG: AbrB/MazE/SpoVT family DNA-binding domain-containing protein [Dehalococcoidia bacterium]|nr:AbrB/MazE/SpoVT family DNA-binding domain-containing protein [Dehalococcoidia bacterium]
MARIGPKHQITIPQESFENLGLEPGDFLEVQVRGEALYLVPQKLIPREQAWFWTREWQGRERDADEAIARGELSAPFESSDDLLGYLRSR